MSTRLVTVGGEHTLRQAAQKMAAAGVGAAVVFDPDGEGPGIITERDLMLAIAEGENPDSECVRGHTTGDVIVAKGEWSLEQAAETMIRGAFRHLVVVSDTGQPEGMLSIRDIVRCWLNVREGSPAG